MPGHRCRQSRTLFDVLSDLHQNLLKVLIVLLLRENLEALNQRQTSIDHYRELPREDRKILGLDLFSATDLRDPDLASLLLNGCERDLLASQDLSQSFAIVRDAFADDDFV